MGTPVVEKPIVRFGLTEVHGPSPESAAQVDLVFVHGLNGDPKNTWTSKETQVFWPRDLLPPFVADQRGRVLVYGYDADVASLGSTGVTKDKIHNHAERLVADLFANRRIRKATERPIIFIAHSLGGLIVKRALISSSEISGAKTEHLRSIYVSTYGILFLGTPHKGSDLGKWGTYLSWLCQAVLPSKLASSESQLVEALKTNSETLLNIDRQFTQLIDDFHIFFFHEAKPTNLKGTLQFIVDEESAAPTLPDVERAGIQADHSHMCKFDSVSAPGFDPVIEGIQRYSDQAPNVIRNRWVMEKRERLTRAVRKAKEIYPVVLDGLEMRDGSVENAVRDKMATPHDSTSDLGSQVLPQPPSRQYEGTEGLQHTQKPSEPFFIVPPGFRSNTFFVGMGKEMHELDRKLFDSRRKDGTACVLLHGQPGVGKSHVARQYVFKNRYKFQGGVFWISAQLIDEMYKDYWQIHQKVVAKVAPEYIQNSTTDKDRDFVDDVREWFSERENWLIIFDGVSVEHDKEVDVLQRFVPDSSNCGIIYVSRSRRLETMQRLLRPHAIKVTGLKEDDAQCLLFKEIGIANPREAQVKAAKVLVKKVGGLPLAISAIARRLADTHEPIEKFNLKSYSDDPKLGSTYYHIMTDLQKNGHREAINLMNIICFLGPHIPVEMIHLGLRSLQQDQIDVRAREDGGNPDINTTFSTLMRHALIERNEPDDCDSLSSSRDSMVEPEPIDILNLHVVIQKYWCDSLNATKQLPLWLSRAVRLMEFSYQRAHFRMQQQEKPGRLSDHRWYLVHARRLRLHSLAYDSRHQRLSEIRDNLDLIISRIEAEIKAREPGSSQESIGQAEFQTSVFDRTSSSSSSDPSQTSLEERFPGRVLVNSADAEEHVTHESPTTLLEMTIAPAPYDPGSDFQFAPSHIHQMERDLSGSTARPGSAGGILYEANLPSPSTNARMSPQRRESFRSASATPIVHPSYATGLVSRQSAQNDNAPSDAISWLTSLHARSPSLPRFRYWIWPQSRSKSTTVGRATQATTASKYDLSEPSSHAMERGHSAPEAIPQVPLNSETEQYLSYPGGLRTGSEDLQSSIGPPLDQLPRGMWQNIYRPQYQQLDPRFQGNAMLQYENAMNAQGLPPNLRNPHLENAENDRRSSGGSHHSLASPQTGSKTDFNLMRPFHQARQPGSIASPSMTPENYQPPGLMPQDDPDQFQNAAFPPNTMLMMKSTPNISHRRGSDVIPRFRGPGGSPLQEATTFGASQSTIQDQHSTRGIEAMPDSSTQVGNHSNTIGTRREDSTGGTHAPPRFVLNAHHTSMGPAPSRQEAGSLLAHTPAPAIAIDGLGINEIDKQFAHIEPDSERRRRIVEWERRASISQDPRAAANLNVQELSERDANINLRAFNLNRTLQGGNDIGSTSAIRSAGTPTVSFAAPTYLYQQNQAHHQRSSSAIEPANQSAMYWQDPRWRQWFAEPLAPSFRTGGPPQMMPEGVHPNRGLMPVEQRTGQGPSYAIFEPRGSPSRSSAPFLHNAAPYAIEYADSGRPWQSPRRRTLSAPETPSPTTSAEQKLWGS